MTKEEIKSFMQDMAKSQGFWGRLLRDIEKSENSEAIWKELENQNFKDILDIVFFFEC